MAGLLDRVASRVLANMSAKRGGNGRSSLDGLAKWPLDDLDRLRNDLEAHVDPEFGTCGRMTVCKSGKTGTPRKLVRSRRT